MPFDATGLPRQDTPASRLINEMARLVEAGWCKGVLSDTKGGRTKYCTLGAFFAAAKVKFTPAIDLSSLVLDGTDRAWCALSDEARARGFYRIEDFNDAFDTTLADVLDYFSAAAERCKAPALVEIEAAVCALEKAVADLQAVVEA